MRERAKTAVELVDALMRVTVLDDLRTRRLCVDWARSSLDQQVYVAEFEDKKPHLFAMVKAFGDVPDGWRQLVRTVREFAHYDLPSAHAANLVEPVPGSPLEAEARQELCRLTRDLDRAAVPDLSRLFGYCAPEAYGPLPATVRTVWEAYELLEQCNVPPDGVPYTLRFLQAVAVAVGPKVGDPLRGWLSRTVLAGQPDGRAAREILHKSRETAGDWLAEADGAAYLLIRLRQATDSPDDVWLTCWTSTGQSWQPRQRDDRYLALADVPSHVARLVDQEEARLRNHHGSLVLEFILPVDLVNLAVEDWTRAEVFGEAAWEGLLAPPLGLEYQVVVRSLERIEALQLHRVWNKRWGVLTGGDGGRTHRCEQGAGARQWDLYTRLLHDPAIVLMALGSSPDDACGRAELLLGIRAGLPVLVWAHEGSLSDDDHAVAERIAGRGGWDSFLKEMGRLRFPPGSRDDGGEGSGSVGSRIAVLWDDPERLPELPEVAG